MTSQSETQDITTEDGQQMVMTSTGDIMTQDQFSALTTLADMTSHEITSQHHHQEEVQMEPQVQQVELIIRAFLEMMMILIIVWCLV